MKIFLTVIITIVAMVALSVVGGLMMRKASPESATAVRVEPPGRGDLVEIVSASGTIEPRTKVSLSARVSALITEIPFREGQKVTRGDATTKPSVLVKLDDKDLQAALRGAQSQYSAQSAQLDVAKTRLNVQEATIKSIQSSLDDANRSLVREKELLKAKISSQAAVDQLQCTVDKLESDLAGAKHALAADKLQLAVLNHNLSALDAEVARCRDSLAYTVITSPIDGVVTRVKAEVGEMAITGTMNNPGTEILQVADLSQMLLIAEVDEAYIGKVAAGQPCKVRIQAYSDRTFEGTVDSVALVQSVGATRNKYFEVKVLIKTGEQRILSGLTADVDIETRRHKDVLKVPSQAVLGRRVDDLPAAIRDGNSNVRAEKSETAVIYRLIDGKAIVTPVTIGPADATCTIIKSGLSDADRIIVGPYKVLEGLKHDQAVKDDRAEGNKPAGIGSKEKTEGQSQPSSTSQSATTKPVAMALPFLSPKDCRMVAGGVSPRTYGGMFPQPRRGAGNIAPAVRRRVLVPWQKIDFIPEAQEPPAYAGGYISDALSGLECLWESASGGLRPRLPSCVPSGLTA